MKNRLISRVCSVLLTAAMLVTSAPASVFAESIGEESVFTDVEAENDFAEPEVEDAQDLESEVVEDVAEEPEAEADQLSDFSDGATVQGTDPVLADGQVDADQVASVSIDMLHAQTEFYEHLTDPCRIVGAVLHITYGDGFTTTLTFNQYSSTVEDNDKGYQWTYTYEKDGQPVSGMLAAGTYDLVLTGKDIRGKGRPDVTVKEGICPITIKPRSEAPKLTVGDENHDIASPADGRDSWYQITAPQTGIYVFEPVGDYVDVIEENGDSLTGVDRLFTHPHEFTSVAYPMTAGKIYYVNFRGNISIYDDDGYHASNTASQMKIYQIPEISAVEVDDTNVQKEFVANQDAVSFEGAKVHINYDNGTSYDLEYNGSSVYDEYGNNFSEYIITNDGMSRGEVELEAGEYKIYFTCNDQNVGQKNGYDIRVIPLKEVRTLQSGSNADIEGCSGRNYWYQFTPGEDGTYKIYPMSINSWVYPEKEDSSSYADSDALSTVSEDDNKDTGLGRTYELKAGTTYYLKFSDHLYTGIDENGYPKYANKADLQIKLVPHVQSASTNLVRTEFTEGWSSTWQPGGFLHLIFSDGATQDVQFEEGVKDSYGNTYRQYYRDASGTEHPLGNFLSGGIYQLVIKCNEKPVPLDKEYTIHVSALDELTELHEGVNKEVKYNKTSGNNQECVWYRFTTKDAGNYVIHGSKEVSSVVREDYGNDYTDLAWGKTDDGDQVYTLEGNKTYYIGLGYDWMDVTETVCDLTITKKEDAPAIQSASLEFGEMNYTERLDDVYLSGTFTVHYENDVEKEFTFDGWNKKEAVDEDYGYVYTYKLQRCDVEDGIEVAPGNSLEAGTYKILISCNGKQITTMDQTYTFQVKAVSQLAELTVGINNGVNSPAGKYCWYRFTAPASGKFKLGINTEDEDAKMGTVSVFQFLDDFEDLLAPEMNAEGYKTYNLKQGTTYYVGFSGRVFLGYDDESDEMYTNVFNLKITYLKEVKKASIEWKLENKIAEYIDMFYLFGILHVTYQDGTTEDVEIRTNEDNQDISGNSYDLWPQKVSVDTDSSAHYPAGTYKAVIYVNTFDQLTIENEEDCMIQVLPVDQMVLGTLKMGTNENIKNPLQYRNAWYTFTPDHTGAYVFDPALRPVVYAMEGKKPVAQREIANSSDYTARYNLTEGITYYVGFSGGFVVGIDPDDQHLICTDIGTVNIHEYQSEDQIGDKMDEIDSTLEEILENIDEDTKELTEEQKERINDSVKDLISIDNEELASRGNLNNVLPISEKLAIMANENVTDTLTDVTDKVGKIQVTGAALTALDAASAGTSQDQVLAAKLTVKESGNTYGYTPGNSLVLSIKLSVVDTKNNNQVVEGKENIQPSAPIRVTMPIPDGMDPDNMKLIHVLGDGTREELPFDYEEKDMTVIFLISSLSDYIFTEENQDSDICTAHVPNENGWVTVKEPTCKETGLKKTTCIKCNTPVEAVIPATGNHSYTVEIGGKAATCSENGYKVLKCATCAETTQTVIPATGNHQAGEWTVVQEATALVAGKKVQKCTVCQKELNVQEIPALPATLTMSVGAKKTVPLKVKQSYTVKVSGLAKGDSVDRFVSSKPKVAAVSNKGKITGKAAGTAVITVKLKSGYSVWFKVKVQKKAVKTTALTVTNAATGKKVAKNVKLGRHKKLKLQATVAPVTSLQKATYTSSNKKVAQAAKNGVITGKKAGTAVITVKSGKKTCKIKVTVK